MTLQEQISKDIVQAMKDKQKDKLEAVFDTQEKT